MQTTKRKQEIDEQTSSQHPFRVAEKKYKKYKNAETDFSEVIDFYNLDKNTEENKTKFKKLDIAEKSKLLFGKNIEAFEFTDDNLKGLYFIKNPFSISEQLYWCEQCLRNYPENNVSNLDAQYGRQSQLFDKASKLVSSLTTGHIEPSAMLQKLRWVTLGYHYDWTNRVYHKENYTKFPEDLADIGSKFAELVGCKNYTSEAAIVNFYHCGMNSMQIRLFSRFNSLWTFRSGDIVIMGGHSRICYHGVPRIIEKTVPEELFKEMENFSDAEKAVASYVKENRININIRQVFPVNSEKNET